MDSIPHLDRYEEFFRLLEPTATSTSSGFAQCRLKLLKFFAWRFCEDPANLADETIVRLIKNVNAGTVVSSDHPYSYVYAVALNVFREYQRTKEKTKIISRGNPADAAAQSVRVVDCRELCLSQLSSDKTSFMARYYLGDREVMMKELRLTSNALRLKVFRIKQRLRRCCADCQKKSKR